MKTDSILCLNEQGYHRMVYQEWGEPDNPDVLICVHGLARNSRDFDELARVMAPRYRVICPDIVGRGQSDWLPAGVEYHISRYLQDVVALIARLDVTQVNWVGTSMGGLIGMLLAAYPGSPVKRLVLNDIGAFIGHQALQRIGSYVGLDERFHQVDQIERLLRSQYQAFKGLSDEQWKRLGRHACRKTADGQLALHYDPMIGEYTRRTASEDVDLWAVWQQVNCPQLVLWGELSDVLTADTVNRMQHLNPELELVRWPGIGHAPSLMEEEQIQVVNEWLQRAPPPPPDR